MSTETPALSSIRGSDPFPVPLRLRVLVVDDNKDAADSTAELLTVCGADAWISYGGEAALGAVGAFRPDACVLDLGMPDMSGLELARRLRDRADGGELLLVALTALGDAATRAQVAAAGFDSHLVKPADPAALLHQLGEHLARRRAAAPAVD